jgi:hypothetical protein
MLIGHGFNRLERGITEALCSGGLRLRESEFLQNVSRKIWLYRERTLLSNAQARWLFTILTSFENGTRNSSAKAQRPANSTAKISVRSS